MSFNKSHFIFTRSQRNGIFFMVFLIILLVGGIFWVKQTTPKSNLSKEQEKEFLALQASLDSLKKEKLKQKKKAYTIFPFNPNFITDYRGYTLGMSPEEIDRLHSFREKNQWINSAQDFKKVTKVSDSLLAKISPYFKFPEWVIAKQKQDAQKVKNSKPVISYAQKTDLNTANAEELQTVNGIGERLALRIIRYRTKIDGFLDDSQIKDIYGLKYETEQELLRKFTVKTPPEIEILDINTASLIELSEVVYFNYELAREIIDYRELHEGIKTFEELAKIEDFPAYKIERLKLYLKIK